MFEFKDFDIKPLNKGFKGEKVKIFQIINREIKVHEYKIENSKFDDSTDGKRLQLQISIADKFHVLFTGSYHLKEMIQRVPKDKFPFSTTIEQKEDKKLVFT